MNVLVDQYLAEGCGRCALGGTPDCKVHNWPEELRKLRAIALDCGLTEEVKWGVPCYTFQNANVLTIGAFKESCALSFFKGSLLKDEHRVLAKPGENSQAGRVIRFTSVRDIDELEPILKAYILEAIEAEKAGLKPETNRHAELVFPEEFLRKLEEMPALKAAFDALTPGRQRGYHLFFTAPKQAKTREARIEKCIPLILAGKGLHD
ncbi:MAG TPA: DUF1801 domain-containing protein [Paenibacillus sp.]|nr:DUF1801 domain-containing protein [Paenibacillus sp.]